MLLPWEELFRVEYRAKGWQVVDLENNEELFPIFAHEVNAKYMAQQLYETKMQKLVEKYLLT